MSARCFFSNCNRPITFRITLKYVIQNLILIFNTKEGNFLFKKIDNNLIEFIHSIFSSQFKTQ